MNYFIGIAALIYLGIGYLFVHSIDSNEEYKAIGAKIPYSWSLWIIFAWPFAWSVTPGISMTMERLLRDIKKGTRQAGKRYLT